MPMLSLPVLLRFTLLNSILINIMQVLLRLDPCLALLMQLVSKKLKMLTSILLRMRLLIPLQRLMPRVGAYRRTSRQMLLLPTLLQLRLLRV